MAVILRVKRRALLESLAVAASFFVSQAAYPAPLSRHGLLVSIGREIREFDQHGKLLQTFVVPTNTRNGLDRPRDLLVTQRGTVLVFVGTQTPRIATLRPATGRWTTQSVPDWQASWNIYSGGLARDGNRLFATNGVGGLAEFSVWGRRTPVLHPGVVPSFDVSGPVNGEIFVLANIRTVFVYDAETLRFKRAFFLRETVLSIDVLDDGTILGTGQVQYNLYRFSPDGRTILGSLYLDSPAPFDIDVDSEGHVAVGGWGPFVAITDTKFTSLRRLEIEQPTNSLPGIFVAFTEH